GHVQLFHDRTVPGPYKKEAREYWLRRVLEAQQSARQKWPEEFREIELISHEELNEIRRIWLYEKHEFDDSLPRIYEEVTGEAFPRRGTDASGLRAEDWETLREVCGEDQALFDLQVALLGVERQYRGMARRASIYEALEERLRTGLFGNEQEAVAVLSDQMRRRTEAVQGALFRFGLPIVEAPDGSGTGRRSRGGGPVFFLVPRLCLGTQVRRLRLPNSAPARDTIREAEP